MPPPRLAVQALDLNDLRRAGFAVALYSDVPWAELARQRGLAEFLGALPHHALIVLYRTSPQYGHYIALILRPDGRIELFDSTGRKPDELASVVEPDVLHELGEYYPLLSAAMRASGRELIYNDRRIQERGTETCGYWAMARILAAERGLNEYQFIDKMDQLARGMGVAADDALLTVVAPLADVRSASVAAAGARAPRRRVPRR